MPEEYISREKTLALLKSLGSRDYRREKGTIQDAIKMISSSAYTPAADVAPVVHGQWKKVRKSGSTWECSACGVKVGAFLAGCSQYCYCCGARMDMDGAAE